MILPPLLRMEIDSQRGKKSITGWDTAHDLQMLNLLKFMPKADFANKKWQWIQMRMVGCKYTNIQIASHVSILLNYNFLLTKLFA